MFNGRRKPVYCVELEEKTCVLCESGKLCSMLYVYLEREAVNYVYLERKAGRRKPVYSVPGEREAV